MSNYVLVLNNELYHHGIKGQKWGVRRYQNEDGTLTSAGKEHKSLYERRQDRYSRQIQRQNTKSDISRTALGKKMHIKKAEILRGKKNKSENIHNAKTLGEKASQALGYGAKKEAHDTAARYNERAAKVSKTKLGKHLHEVKAYNQKQLANYSQVMKDKDFYEKVFENRIYSKELMNTKVKTLSGKESTYGKEAAKKFIASVVVGVAVKAVTNVAEKKMNG